MSLTPEELRQLARNDVLAFTSLEPPKTPAELLLRPCQPITGTLPAEPEPMTLAELQRGLAVIAAESHGLDAALAQVGGTLRFLMENGTDTATLGPLQTLARALNDLRGGNAAPLLKPARRATKHKGQRGLHELRETLVALLVEAFTCAWPCDERRRREKALAHVARALAAAGIERKPDSERGHRGGKAYDAEALAHWRRRAVKREDWSERIAELKGQGRWPKGPGDTQAAEALLADLLPRLASETGTD